MFVYEHFINYVFVSEVKHVVQLTFKFLKLIMSMSQYFLNNDMSNVLANNTKYD
jgi:hypothetical protein